MNFKHLIAAGMACFLITASCNKDDNPPSGNGGGGNPGGGNPGGGGNTGTLKISGATPAYAFWGKEVTITGTGFSANAADNIVSIRGYGVTVSDTVMSVDVVSATATQLVVKVPYKLVTGGGDTVYRGFDYGKFRVKINDKMVTADSNSRFVGIPSINNICYTFGQQQYQYAVQPGDSVVMSCGIPGIYGNDQYFESLRVYINGAKVTSAKRLLNAICGGLIFYLPPKDYCDLNNCTVPSPGGVHIPTRPARKMTFQLKIEGTDIAGPKKEFYVINQPNTQVVGTVGGNFSKSGGGNPYGEVTGKFFHFKNIRWSTAGLADVHTSPPAHDVNSTSLKVYIPLSILEAYGNGARTYMVYGITSCDEVMAIGQVNILP
ncbi:IPT/TIG domain-containing protein [Paraflavitalea sp. CAU 1676]|uniref:IPT/TIG domain-containing protein n=1 Tax=Paraflavitalea sp. CAU 1676 TaxID=3032598 RepID=UPI0023DCC32C|nr:IPT/TIG domain-containing protein [Paraflavitalea sp. CAU 1676]MDF2190340.1 IPT/TIG domain-containing protein [Paraflavitalea sp. CAU 1676]